MLPFVLAELPQRHKPLPLSIYCIGSHEQKHLIRPEGFPTHQLFLTRQGTGQFVINRGEHIVLKPGSALLLKEHVSHEYYPAIADGQWELGFVAFRGAAAETMLDMIMGSSEAATAVAEQNKHYLFEPNNFNELWEKLELLWHMISVSGEDGYWEASLGAYDLLLTAIRGHNGMELKQSVTPGGDGNAALKAGVQLMHDHYNERLLLANVARASGYSVQHFHRLFVSSYGMTPNQYMNRIRMKRAVQLLEELGGASGSVEKVAMQLGMETSYFIRLFKKTYGTTPKQWKTI
ncbi:AraC family transcriptional regulator [Paenibacillus sp. CF384]|uniref:AraC family transcriptional regulator n=1 Tax=Paenibacillus sp. CF384 TaxID=1884382 RepID=UPI00089909F4|nr:AraC family transcriptional regulator [Paenibacillus sp. CF384]SDX62839.1 AraC-type DNA-binding protein [Paenibacillus sp. CF384]